MILAQTVTVQKSGTNVYVNIPIEERKALGIMPTDKVVISADTAKGIITIKKKEV